MLLLNTKVEIKASVFVSVVWIVLMALIIRENKHKYNNVRFLLSVKPTAKVSNCPSVGNEDQTVACVCEGIGGNPPANASWIKNGTSDAIGGVESLKKTLSFNPINRANTGTYRCIAESFDLVDEESINIIVLCKLKINDIKIPRDFIGIFLIQNPKYRRHVATARDPRVNVNDWGDFKWYETKFHSHESPTTKNLIPVQLTYKLL